MIFFYMYIKILIIIFIIIYLILKQETEINTKPGLTIWQMIILQILKSSVVSYKN